MTAHPEGPAGRGTTGDASFRALTRAAPPETIEAHVRRYIVEHGLRPGDRLPSEADLMSAVGASRVTVREALRSLEALGVLESRAGSGWYVRPFDISVAVKTFARSLAFHPSALLDLLAVRTSVEGDLVPNLAGRLSAADLARLEALVDRIQWLASRGQHYADEDGEFHRRLVAATGNLVALALIDLYFGVTDALYRQGFPRPEASALKPVAETHGAILDALKRGDREAVRLLLSEAHHQEAQRRFNAWLASQRERLEGAERDSDGAVAAVQAALLWPGPDARG